MGALEALKLVKDLGWPLGMIGLILLGAWRLGALVEQNRARIEDQNETAIETADAIRNLRRRVSKLEGHADDGRDE